jgi:N-methylhydantoinase A
VDFVKSETLGAEIIAGPAVIEADTSTCFVPDGWTARQIESGSLLLVKTP